MKQYSREKANPLKGEKEEKGRREQLSHYY